MEKSVNMSKQDKIKRLEMLHDVLEDAATAIIIEYPKEADGLGTYLKNQEWYVGIYKVTKKLRLSD